MLPRVFAPARCSIEHQPVYKIPIIKILVGVFARARAMEKYEERSPRTFYQALEDGTCRGFYIRFLCSDCEKLNRIRTLFFYRNWYLICFRVLMTKLYTSCPIENFEKLRKGEASNRPLCLRMPKREGRAQRELPDDQGLVGHSTWVVGPPSYICIGTASKIGPPSCVLY